jgi:drug/metabolite transporter (DMT)-like permease
MNFNFGRLVGAAFLLVGAVLFIGDEPLGRSIQAATNMLVGAVIYAAAIISERK